MINFYTVDFFVHLIVLLRVKKVHFVNPISKHGDIGSTTAHNELLKIIDSSLDYSTFKRRLKNWAHYRLKGGINSLPEGLR